MTETVFKERNIPTNLGRLEGPTQLSYTLYLGKDCKTGQNLEGSCLCCRRAGPSSSSSLVRRVDKQWRWKEVKVV
jgi:hypothetical protein